MVLGLLHFFLILFVGLAVWDMFGILAALAAIVIVSVPFVALAAAIQHRFVNLIVRDN